MRKFSEEEQEIIALFMHGFAIVAQSHNHESAVVGGIMFNQGGTKYA